MDSPELVVPPVDFLADVHNISEFVVHVGSVVKLDSAWDSMYLKVDHKWLERQDV